jgi:hypothetical protein
MNELLTHIEKQLASTSVTLETFRKIATRLLANGVISYGDSTLESTLYNDAKRIEYLLDDYFVVIDCKLFHEPDFQYFCLFPPGSDIPGSTTAEEDEETDTSLRERFSQDEVASILILRLLYQQVFQEGALNEQAEAPVTLESFHTTMQTRLNRSLSSIGTTKRKEVFQKLRRRKFIRYSSNANLDNQETVLAIRPIITNFVHSDALEAIIPPQPTNVPEAEAVQSETLESSESIPQSTDNQLETSIPPQPTNVSEAETLQSETLESSESIQQSTDNQLETSIPPQPTNVSEAEAVQSETLESSESIQQSTDNQLETSIPPQPTNVSEAETLQSETSGAIPQPTDNKVPETAQSETTESSESMPPQSTNNLAAVKPQQPTKVPETVQSETSESSEPQPTDNKVPETAQLETTESSESMPPQSTDNNFAAVKPPQPTKVPEAEAVQSETSESISPQPTDNTISEETDSAATNQKPALAIGIQSLSF